MQNKGEIMEHYIYIMTKEEYVYFECLEKCPLCGNEQVFDVELNTEAVVYRELKPCYECGVYIGAVCTEIDTP